MNQVNTLYTVYTLYTLYTLNQVTTLYTVHSLYTLYTVYKLLYTVPAVLRDPVHSDPGSAGTAEVHDGLQGQTGHQTPGGKGETLLFSQISSKLTINLTTWKN